MSVTAPYEVVGMKASRQGALFAALPRTATAVHAQIPQGPRSATGERANFQPRTEARKQF